MEEILKYGCVNLEAENGRRLTLEYYLVPELITKEYPELIRYGVGIKKTCISAGGAKDVEFKQIHNIFYRLSDAENFMQMIIKDIVTPRGLQKAVEDYIIMSIKQ